MEAPLRVQALGVSTQQGLNDKKGLLWTEWRGGGVATAVALEERWVVASEVALLGLYRPGRGAFLPSERNASGREKNGRAKWGRPGKKKGGRPPGGHSPPR